jgi:UDP-2-acetamido-3-amino-2,3-dideoxy-glucuronate N-acetyltransferase
MTSSRQSSETLMIHPQALCESRSVGYGTRIWAFAHVLPGAQIGCDCNICDGVFIENDVTIGNRVTVKCGVQVWDGVRLEDDVYVGPNATFTNDRFPRSKVYLETYAQTVVRQGASIGANATVLPGIEIGAGAMVGAGAVVTHSVPANAVVMGNPARITGYVDANRSPPAPSADQRTQREKPSAVEFGIGGATLNELRLIEDLRGTLSVAEFAREIPFVPKRYFVVFGVPSKEVRGEHAHRTCHQFLVCIHGSVSILLDDGRKRREVRLDRVDMGVYLPPMVWGTQYRYSSDAVLLVFASHDYDPTDYIRTYEEYLRVITGRDAGAATSG